MTKPKLPSKTEIIKGFKRLGLYGDRLTQCPGSNIIAGEGNFLQFSLYDDSTIGTSPDTCKLIRK